VGGQHQDLDFAEYVSARGPWLRKLGYLLSGDWHQADDLAQAAITKLYARWNRLDVHNLDGYARTTLVNTFLAERRSPWRRVLLRGEPEHAAPQADLEAILDLRQALASCGVAEPVHGAGAGTAGLPDEIPPTAWGSAGGLVYCISSTGKLPPAVTAIGGLQGLLKKVTVLGPDPQNWTTDVLR
jgi:hypothetical protein